MNTFQCPTRNRLSDYALGKIQLDEALDIEAHLETCEECRTTLQSAWKVDDGLLLSLRKDKRSPKTIHRGAKADSAESGDDFHRVEHPKFVRDYRILKLLGRGGMGTVYLAQNERFAGGKKVAIKLIKPDRMNDEKLMARFHRETAAMGAFEHPNLVSAVDAGEHDGRLYLVMEYVEGLNLAELVDRNGPLSSADACEAVRQAAHGLQHACDQLNEFVHRDIKPSNLLVNKDGVVKIADLGLVRADGLFEEDASLTASSSFLGTLDYVAPEQIDRTQDVDIRADIYSLGATLYKLLAGDPPFSDSQFGQFSKRIYAISHLPHKPLSDLRPDLSPELMRIVDGLLAKRPMDRPTLPIEVVVALEPFCEGSDLCALVSEHASSLSPRKEIEKTSTFGVARSAVVDTSRIETRAKAQILNSAASSLEVNPLPLARRTLFGGRHSRNFWMIGVAFFMPLILLAGFLITLNTGKGILEIHVTENINVQEVKVDISRIEDGAKVVEGYKLVSGGNDWTLKAGEYVIKMACPEGTELRLNKDRVSIDRGKRSQIEVTSKSRMFYTGQTPDEQRETAQWLLRKGAEAGGNVWIGIDREEDLRPGQPLPDEDFDIVDVVFWSEARFSERDVERLVGLSKLRGLRIVVAGDECLQHIGKLPRLESLMLIGSNITGRGLADLSSCTRLRDLHLDNNPIEARYFDRLPKLPDLALLNLYACGLEDDSLRAIAKLDRLEILALPENRISKDGLIALGSLTRLRRLELDGNSNVDDACIPVLTAQFPRLTSIFLGNTRVTAVGVARLPRSITNLILGGLDLRDPDVAVLGEFRNLQELSLEDTFITDKALETIRSLPKLKILSLSGTHVSDDGIRGLIDLPELEELSVERTSVTSTGVDWIRRNLSLTTLNNEEIKLP